MTLCAGRTLKIKTYRDRNLADFFNYVTIFNTHVTFFEAHSFSIAPDLSLVVWLTPLGTTSISSFFVQPRNLIGLTSTREHADGSRHTE